MSRRQRGCLRWRKTCGADVCEAASCTFMLFNFSSKLCMKLVDDRHMIRPNGSCFVGITRSCHEGAYQCFATAVLSSRLRSPRFGAFAYFNVRSFYMCSSPISHPFPLVTAVNDINRKSRRTRARVGDQLGQIVGSSSTRDVAVVRLWDMDVDKSRRKCPTLSC